ncbi:unnamed protein product [Polarella glacialis]|uniref:Uncharacterized protein n=1 Tax=Polarella glacialis TaxID=89957 RepID=A0A813KYI8_POLGL|nr:unnamed protein product [Polarella glacialis]
MRGSFTFATANHASGASTELRRSSDSAHHGFGQHPGGDPCARLDLLVGAICHGCRAFPGAVVQTVYTFRHGELVEGSLNSCGCAWGAWGQYCGIAGRQPFLEAGHAREFEDAVTTRSRSDYKSESRGPVDKIPPSYTMRLKTKILENTSQTGPKVGPGVYPAPDACGTQASSERPSKPLWTLHQNDRFPRKLDKPDTSRLWDGSGDKKVQFSRCFSSPGSFSFGTSTRFHASKVALALTPLDKGPAGDMGHHRPAQPSEALFFLVVLLTGCVHCCHDTVRVT